MERHYLLVSILLLIIVTGVAVISVIPVSPLQPGSGLIPDELEQTSNATTEHTAGSTPTIVTQTPGAEPTSLSTPPLTIASGSGAVYPYPLSTTALEQRVHELINQKRAENGLGPLGFDPALAEIARNHSEDMAAHHYFAHINPAGQNPTARGTAANYSLQEKLWLVLYSRYCRKSVFEQSLYCSHLLQQP